MKKKLFALISVCSVFLGLAFGLQQWSFYTGAKSFIHNKLWVRCKVAQKDWGPWMDPFENMRQGYFKTIVAGEGKVLFSYAAYPISLYLKYQEIVKKCEDSKISLKECKPIEKSLLSEEYAQNKRLAKDICLTTINESSELFQFKIMTFWPKTINERSLEKRWGYVEEYLFPVENIANASYAITK